MCSLPTALLSLHKWHFKWPLCQAPEVRGWKWDTHIDSEDVLPSPAEEIQPTTGAAETVLLCHLGSHVLIHNCLVWFSYQIRHQETTTDSQDCWKDHWSPSAQVPRSLHLQSEEKGPKSPWTHHTQPALFCNCCLLVSATENWPPEQPGTKTFFSHRLYSTWTRLNKQCPSQLT